MFNSADETAIPNIPDQPHPRLLSQTPLVLSTGVDRNGFREVFIAFVMDSALKQVI